MSQDTVLPPGGGWIIVKAKLPANLPQVPLMSLFWAMPEKVLIEGCLDITRWPSPGQSLNDTDLWQVYKSRHTSQRMYAAERDTAEKAIARYAEETGDELRLEMRVRIRTPTGDVCVEPHEWVPCGDVQPFFNEIGRDVTLHEYGDTARARGWADRLFYLRSRGIGRADALRLLFGEVRGPNVMWLEIAPHIAGHFVR